MCSFWILSLVTFSWHLHLASSVKPNQVIGYDTAYELGMDAYRKEKWSQCSKFFKRAIENYHLHQNIVAECRLKCQTKKFFPNSTMLTDVFHDFLEKGTCLRKCNKKKLGPRAEVEISAVTTKKFQERTPYNFLHYCYYKVLFTSL